MKVISSLHFCPKAYRGFADKNDSVVCDAYGGASEKLIEAGKEAEAFSATLREMAEKYGIEFSEKDLSQSTGVNKGEVSFVPVNGEFQMNVKQFVSIMDLELSNHNYKKMSEWESIAENIKGVIYVTYELDKSFAVCFSTADDGNIKGFTYFIRAAEMDAETAQIMGYLLVRTVGKVDLEQCDGIINSLGNFSSADGTIANASGRNADYSYIVDDGLAMFSINAKQ